MRNFNNIIYGSHGTADETAALKQALSLARNNNAPLTGLVACPEFPTPPWANASSVLPPWQPPWVQAVAPPSEDAPETPHDDDYVDEYAFAEDNPGWNEEPSEPEDDTITVRPGERVPTDAGELLRTFYAPGIGDMRVYTRLDPNKMDVDPGQVLGEEDFERDGPEPEKKPKSPK